VAGSREYSNTLTWSVRNGEFFDWLSDYYFLQVTLLLLLLLLLLLSYMYVLPSSKSYFSDCGNFVVGSCNR
jgi:hypothetical protein